LEAPNNGDLASHGNKRLYTLGADVDRRKDEMDKRRKGKNG